MRRRLESSIGPQGTSGALTVKKMGSPKKPVNSSNLSFHSSSIGIVISFWPSAPLAPYGPIPDSSLLLNYLSFFMKFVQLTRDAAEFETCGQKKPIILATLVFIPVRLE